MKRDGSRRTFLGDLLAVVAGGVAAIVGLVSLSAAMSGCSDDSGPAPKYGVLPPDLGPAPKYGVLPPDLGPAPKYGALLDLGPAPKYGIPG